jgi:NAD(P)-dependent dehydrogenase (short-subunit alcohol dehydrogenase family)
MDRFAGRRVVVTGATSGIGQRAAAAFVREGACVATIGRNVAQLDADAEAWSRDGHVVVPLAADLADPEARASVAERALEALGGVDVLVNAAGIIGFGTIENTTPSDWSHMMELNVTAPMDLTQRFVPALRERPGCVVNVSSVTGLRSFPGVLAYSVSKAAVDQLTRCAALELAASGIRVNAVNPGVVVTGLHRTAGLDDSRYAAFLQHSRTTHPLGRVGTPDEVADLILFLASDAAAWITGATMPVDGGRHLTCAR